MVNIKKLERISLILFILFLIPLLFFYKTGILSKIKDIEGSQNVIVEGNLSFEGISKKGNYKYLICDRTGCCLLISKRKLECERAKVYGYVFGNENCAILLKKVLECYK